jgi:uncharacterized membrane protein
VLVLAEIGARLQMEAVAGAVCGTVWGGFH